MGAAGNVATGGVIALVSTCVLVAVFTGIGIAVILSIIPTYTSTRTISPLGEKYCINNLQLNVTFNSTYPNGNFSSLSANTSYPLSEACYRILQNYKSDTLLSACLISNCSFVANVTSDTGFVSPNLTCSAIIYYSSRCPDEGTNIGLYNNVYSTTNSACRKKRLTNINGALGSTSSTQFTNVATLIVSSILIPVKTIYTIAFSTYSQLGAIYCGTATRAVIASAVSSQATG